MSIEDCLLNYKTGWAFVSHERAFEYFVIVMYLGK